MALAHSEWAGRSRRNGTIGNPWWTSVRDRGALIVSPGTACAQAPVSCTSATPSSATTPECQSGRRGRRRKNCEVISEYDERYTPTARSPPSPGRTPVAEGSRVRANVATAEVGTTDFND